MRTRYLLAIIWLLLLTAIVIAFIPYPYHH